MNSPAPTFRAVDQHTGDIADRPSKFWEAQAEADERCSDYERLSDENAELQIRNGELWQTVCDQSAELNALRAQLDRARAELVTLVAVSK